MSGPGGVGAFCGLSLLGGHVEEVETTGGVFAHEVVGIINFGGNTIGLEQSVTVEPVHEVVGNLQQPAWQPILEVENIEAGQLFDRFFILLIIRHHLAVAVNAPRVNG